MESALLHKIIRYKSGSILLAEDQMLIGEEPLSIRVENSPYAVVMRTPGDERFLAAGFCLAEGLVDRIEDFAHPWILRADGSQRDLRHPHTRTA